MYVKTIPTGGPCGPGGPGGPGGPPGLTDISQVIAGAAVVGGLSTPGARVGNVTCGGQKSPL